MNVKNRVYTQNDAMISDERIVELYFERNEQAIAETNRKYGAMLLSIARRILYDESDCEECLNDAYLGVWNAIPPVRPRSFPAFITQIMRRMAVNRYHERSTVKRNPSRYTVSLDELAEVLCASDSVESEWESAELGRLINAFLGTRTQRERYLFIGRFYFSQTLEDLATELHVHISTVHRTIEKIKRELKAYLERNGMEI